MQSNESEPNFSTEHKLPLIRIVDYKGKLHLVSIYAIAKISETATSSQWHGIKSIITLTDGDKIESSETVDQITRKIHERV